jgi:cystathionine beta-lyase/cystathionine gamma-synthase
MVKPKLKRHYSGNHSKRFWNRLNAIDHVAYKDAAYLLGCTMQDLEARVLQFVENAEAIVNSRVSSDKRCFRKR